MRRNPKKPLRMADSVLRLCDALHELSALGAWRPADEDPGESVLTIPSPDTVIAADWRELALCRDSEPSLFFPVGSTGPAMEQIAEAKTICAECPVQESCLQYALTTNQEAGVWGGYAEDERRRLRKRWLAERRRRQTA
jgi:WhiB family redox-sensing transcriptional regulator